MFTALKVRRFRPRGRGRWVVPASWSSVGGIGLAISPFLPWVKVVLLGSLSLFQLFDAAGRSNGWAWAAVLAGGAAAVIAFRAQRPSTVRRAGLSIGVLGGILAVYALVALRNELRDAQGLAQIGIGPYIAVAGCIAMVIGAVMSKSTSQPAQTRQPTQRGTPA